MTTTVIVKAHCSSEKEVSISINDKSTGTLIERFTLQDGETAERYVYDGREINVLEVTK